MLKNIENKAIDIVEQAIEKLDQITSSPKSTQEETKLTQEAHSSSSEKL
jgi:hypothetical protein